MQLPFVLQSAEVMKTAVAHLEPHMERSGDEGKGTIVLATVKGDVHDIGKNLVDIILSNNGYTVVNIGIKQPVSEIIEQAEKNTADVIGMSGLLVKSTIVMRENLAGDQPPRRRRRSTRCCSAVPRSPVRSSSRTSPRSTRARCATPATRSRACA